MRVRRVSTRRGAPLDERRRTRTLRRASATKSWRAYRVLRPSGGEKCGLAHQIVGGRKRLIGGWLREAITPDIT